MYESGKLPCHKMFKYAGDILSIWDHLWLQSPYRQYLYNRQIEDLPRERGDRPRRAYDVDLWAEPPVGSRGPGGGRRKAAWSWKPFVHSHTKEGPKELSDSLPLWGRLLIAPWPAPTYGQWGARPPMPGFCPAPQLWWVSIHSSTYALIHCMTDGQWHKMTTWQSVSSNINCT